MAGEGSSGVVGESSKTPRPRKIALIAYKYLAEVVGAAKISDIRTEELQLMDADKSWNVVLSYDIVGDFPFDKRREYKEFKIDDATEKVIYMKIKKV